MESRRYDYGSGAGTGGKIRRHPPSRAVAASPYARPATAPTNAPGTATAAVSQGGGWLSRIIAAGTSRFLPSLFRTSPPQLTALAPPPHELLEPPSRDLLLLNAPPSPLPPPLEDELPECEENSGVAANNLFTENPQSSAKGEEENMLRNSNDHGGMALEELLKQRTFTRSEFEYLANLLWSKTIGANSLKPEDGNIRKMIVYDKENGSEHSNLPLDFSTTTYSIDDQVVSPAEIAKAYMGSKSSKGSPLRLRLHDPSSMPITSIEASMSQKAKPPTIPLAQGSRLHTSKTSDRLESNYTTPNGAIYKISSSPYFKSGVSSKDLFGSVSSHYQTSSSVHTFGRISKSVLGGAVTQKLDSKLNTDDQQMPSKNSGQGASFTSNPVFKVDGPGYASNSIVSAIQPSNTSIGSASFQSAGSSTISTNLASKSTQSCSTGGSLTFSNTGFGSLSAAKNMFAGSSSEFVAARSLASSCTGSPSVAFGFPPVRTASSPAVQRKSEAANSSSTTFSSMREFGIAGSSTMQDKSKAVDSSTPFGFSQKFHTASSASEDMSKAASAEPTFFSGNHNAQSKNCSSLFTQSPANTLCFKSSENLNSGSSHSFVDSPVGSATMGSSPLNSSSLFSWAAASGPTSVTGTAPPSSPATSSSFAFSSSPAFLAQSVFSSKFTTPAPPSYGSPNNGPATSPFSPMPSAVFSFTSATPSIPNPPTPIFGDPTVQMNGGNMVDRNGSPSPATSPFGLPSSSSPLTPTFSTPATQFASSTSGSPGVFEVGQYSQVSSGGFSMGPSGGIDKSGRRTIRVKRRK